MCIRDRLERVVKYTFSNVGNTFSAKSIADYLKAERRSLDNETVYSYLEKDVYKRQTMQTPPRTPFKSA